jgi:hypothetical protein
MSGYHVICEAENDADDSLAMECSRYLVEAYPGHPWHVAIAGGVMTIKHMAISGKMGMVLHYRKWAHDAGALKRGVVFSGGELLERAGLTRGAWTEKAVGKVEGVTA